ncbi:MAG: hypothetical protein SWZ49_00350, partial [Cyanobacteriota bacterium]|nr:hypothetical protein [Cyanobacteriota bacterium]
MQVIQSQLGITRTLSDTNKHLLVRKSHSLIKPIAVREPLIRPSRLFLSRKSKKSSNPVIGYENWNEGGLANESILTDYSEVNYSNDTSSNLINLQEFDGINPIITAINNDDTENIINQKSQKQNTKKQNNTKKKINKTKAATKIQKKSQSKVKTKTNNHNSNINNSEFNSSQNINSLFSTEEFSTKSIQQQITDTNTNTNNKTRAKHSSSIIDDASDNQINPSFLQLDENQNTQLFAETDLSDSENQESKLISDNHLDLFTSESSTVQKSQNPALSNQNKNLDIDIDIDIELNAKKLDNNLTLPSQNIDKSSSQEKLSDITAEDTSKHENTAKNPDITSPTLEEASTVINDFSSHQDDNNQNSIISDTNFSISNPIEQAEIPLEKIISTSNNQNFSVDSQSQSIITNPQGIETNQFISAENQEIPSKLHPDISNTDIHRKELLEDKNIN